MDIEVLDGTVSNAAAEHVMPRFGRLSAAEIREKTSAFDVVTTVDTAVERTIFEAVQARWPGTLVRGPHLVPLRRPRGKHIQLRQNVSCLRNLKVTDQLHELGSYRRFFTDLTGLFLSH